MNQQKIRPLSEKKYGISKHRFLQLYHHCMQYNEWRDELAYKTNTVGSQVITDMPAYHSNTDATQQLAMRRGELTRKCTIIEQTAIEADPDLYQYLLKAVTNDWVSYKYLKQVMGIPCGKNMYYERRRKFYYLLSTKV